MKHTPLLLLYFLTVLNTSLFAQEELCQGPYFTEEQGRTFLQSQVPKSLADWQSRSKLVKDRVLDGMELRSMPARPTSVPIIHSRREMDGYTVENVAFESMPGIYVTGNLYRPAQKLKSYAVILSPHGHGPDMRFHEQTQKRCGTLARMGAIVFAPDMIGQGDSKQCEHKLSKALKLQTINNIRALDFLLALPSVDPERVAVVGESGGGTQTFVLTALDPRVKVAAPTVMVSSYFFGGCTCESGMPIHKKGEFQTNNVEIAALAAPRPMLLISDGGDWTKNTPQVEYPHIQNIYTLYNAKDKVSNVHLANEKHDFGPNKRAAMYPFMAKYLKLDEKQVDESRVQVLDRKVLAVFDEAHPRPANALQGDEAVLGVL
ncbi:acetylxylan esterase [Telluribacter sp. SYSU D00476]|uniref:alpha/beta hydrolase family protein n=1 Tax=Telluribacter sp. SYSU D00476 TaxID=2811430 RepID=UPI001FF587AB